MKPIPLLLPLLIIAAPVHAETLTITSAEYGAKWPFTVNQIELSCHNVAAVLISANGKTYTLNGKSKMQFKQLPDSRDITKPEPKYGAGAVMPLPSDMIQRGLALCPK